MRRSTWAGWTESTVFCSSLIGIRSHHLVWTGHPTEAARQQPNSSNCCSLSTPGSVQPKNYCAAKTGLTELIAQYTSICVFFFCDIKNKTKQNTVLRKGLKSQLQSNNEAHVTTEPVELALLVEMQFVCCIRHTKLATQNLPIHVMCWINATQKLLHGSMKAADRTMSPTQNAL